MKNLIICCALTLDALTSPLPLAQTSPQEQAPSTSTEPPSNTQKGMSEADLRAFCTDKPIWSAFAIDPETCLVPATACSQQEAFNNIDPVLLSEPFYNCVFKGLGIEI